MICECCRKEKATIKDYRETKTGMNKYFVCAKCLMLKDQYFFRKMSINKRKEM